MVKLNEIFFVNFKNVLTGTYIRILYWSIMPLQLSSNSCQNFIFLSTFKLSSFYVSLSKFLLPKLKSKSRAITNSNNFISIEQIFWGLKFYTDWLCLSSTTVILVRIHLSFNFKISSFHVSLSKCKLLKLKSKG